MEIKESYSLLYPQFLYLLVAQHITRIQRRKSLGGWTAQVARRVQYTGLSKDRLCCTYTAADRSPFAHAIFSSLNGFLPHRPRTSYSHLKTHLGLLVAPSVKHPTSAQVMISQFVSLNPVSGSVLTVQRLLGILSHPLSLCPSLAHALSISLSKNK